MNSEEANQIRLKWQLARDKYCDDCPQARGCKEPCQLLRNAVKNSGLQGLKVTEENLE